MEPRFNSSFIPKAPLAGQSSDLPKKKRGKNTNLAPIASGIVFILALATTGGLLVYEQVMVSSITNKVEQLEDIQARIDPNLIAELERYANRLEGARALLDAHLAPSFLEELLAQTTLSQGMRFESLQFDRAGDSAVQLRLEGQSANLESLVLQSDVLNDLFLIEELFISDVFLEKNEMTGETTAVSFTASSRVLPEALRFTDLLPDEGGATSQNELERTTQDPVATSSSPTSSAEAGTTTGAVVDESREPL